MTLRILHTADWHLGQTLQGFPRDSEHEAALGELVQIARQKKIDALILAGDIFDRETPPARAETLFYATMMQLRADNPQLTIVLVAGNHDSAGRVEAPRPLYAALGIHAVGHISRKDGALDMARHLVPLPDAAGVVRAHILAIPYLHAANLPGYAKASEEGGSPIVREVGRLYAEAFANARALAGGLPVIATGHLNVKGGEVSGGAERAILIGGEHAVPADAFDSGFAYVALGHLHKPHPAGRREVRYSGSLFPLSATEMGHAHGVTLVTLVESLTQIEHVRIARPVPFLRVPETGAMLPGEVEAALLALKLDPALPREQHPFVQLALRFEGPAPSLTADLGRLSQSLPLRLLPSAFPGRDSGGPAAANIPQQNLAERDPADLFAAAFLARHNSPPDERHLRLFHAIMAEA